LLGMKLFFFFFESAKLIIYMELRHKLQAQGVHKPSTERKLNTRKEPNRKTKKQGEKLGKNHNLNYLNNTKVPVSIHKEDKHQPA
jgi:hypothetical protein